MQTANTSPSQSSFSLHTALLSNGTIHLIPSLVASEYSLLVGDMAVWLVCHFVEDRSCGDVNGTTGKAK